MNGLKLELCMYREYHLKIGLAIISKSYLIELLLRMMDRYLEC